MVLSSLLAFLYMDSHQCVSVGFDSALAVRHLRICQRAFTSQILTEVHLYFSDAKLGCTVMFQVPVVPPYSCLKYQQPSAFSYLTARL